MRPTLQNAVPSSDDSGSAARVASLAAPIGPWVASPWPLFGIPVIGLTGQTCMVVIYVLVAHGLGIDLPLPMFVLFLVVANLAILVPIALGRIDVRDARLIRLLVAHTSA